MATFDFTPLFRSTVGFDRMTRLMDSALQRPEQSDGYPPYNIESVDEDRYPQKPENDDRRGNGRPEERG